jgi:REP element-mobilizing transposase RayT
MPDHAHLLVRRHADRAEEMIARFQEATRAVLIAVGKRAATHPVWSQGPGWKGFLNAPDDFVRDVGYVRRNPVQIGRPEQTWDFVTVYDGWPVG